MTSPKTPFRYECQGDSDGETVGCDHFVFDADGNEIALAPDAATGRLFAASPRLLAACRKAADAFRDNLSMWAYKNEPVMLASLDDIEAAIREATEGQP